MDRCGEFILDSIGCKNGVEMDEDGMCFYKFFKRVERDIKIVDCLVYFIEPLMTTEYDNGDKIIMVYKM